MNSKNESKFPNLPLTTKTGNKIQISLCNYDDDEEEDEDEIELKKSTLKNLKPATADLSSGEIKKPKSGLLSILPPPKSSRFINTSNVSKTAEAKETPSFLLPRTLKKPVSLAPVVVNNEESDDDDDNEIIMRAKRLKQDPPLPYDLNQSDTSIFNQERQRLSEGKSNGEIHNYDEDPEPEFGDEIEEKTQITKSASYSRQKLELDKDALQKLCGGNKKKLDIPLEITDIKVNDIVGDNHSELMKQITSEYKPPSNKDYFSGGSRKKHQITYLAHVAKERDQELRNTWAQSKFNKQQARQKYGF